MSALATEKQELRAAMLARRREQNAEDREIAAERLRDHFTSMLMPQRGTKVSGYWPMDEEMDVRPLLADLRENGCVIALPVVVGKGQPLVFRVWHPGDTLVKSGFGLSEPGPEVAEIVPQVLLVPLVAFDASGNRLGFGGGFYDRTLKALRAANPHVRAIGIAFAFQEVDDVPNDDSDQRLDAVVTERGVSEFES